MSKRMDECRNCGEQIAWLLDDNGLDKKHWIACDPATVVEGDRLYQKGVHTSHWLICGKKLKETPPGAPKSQRERREAGREDQRRFGRTIKTQGGPVKITPIDRFNEREGYL